MLINVNPDLTHQNLNLNPSHIRWKWFARPKMADFDIPAWLLSKGSIVIMFEVTCSLQNFISWISLKTQ